MIGVAARQSTARNAGLTAFGRSFGQLCIVPLVLLSIWQILSWLVGDIAVASPAVTLAAIANGLDRGWLIQSFRLTLHATIVGFVIAASFGILLGYLLGRSPFWGRVFELPILWIYSIPKVILYPILVLALGLGLKSNIAFAVLQGLFPPLLILYGAVRDLPPVYIRTARSYQLPNHVFFFRIVVPHTLPAIVMALRYCFSLSYIGVVIAQMFAADEGAGYELVKSISLHQIPKMFAIVTVMMAIALSVNLVFLLVERFARVHRLDLEKRFSRW